MSTEPVSTLIYGSCVSRDIARIAEPRFAVTRYIARQSWISAFTAPLAGPGPTDLTSPFQQRSLAGDFTSNAFNLIAEAAPQSDLVLLDIDCELRGVFPLDGGYVSYTPELSRSGVLESREPGPLLRFGTPQHLELFATAAQKLRDTLDGAGALERTVVVKFPFTDNSTTGEDVPLLAGRSGAEWNAAYVPYYELIEDLGFTTSTLPEELGISTPDHQWGIQQEHYIDDAYLWWSDDVAEHAERRPGNSLVAAEAYPGRMDNTPVTDQLRAHLAEHPGDIDAIVDALAKIEARAMEHRSDLHDVVPEWPV